MFTIYTLEDQRHSGIHAIKYIGMTENVYARFSQHLQCSENNLDKNKWIQELKDCNLMLIMRTLETVETLERARDREQEWIHYYLSQGVRLLNVDVSRSFTYEDFLAKFGKPAKKVKEPKIETPPVRGDAAKRTMRILRRHPNIGATELARKAQVSRGYAHRILANSKRQMSEVAIEQ